MNTAAARALPVALGVAALLGFTGLWYVDRPLYVELFTLCGFTPFRYPFVDLGGSLSAWDCARRGVDVILSDPCDVLRRGYNYAPFWMTLDWMPLTQADRPWLGFSLDVCFLLALAGLPAPLSWAEAVGRAVAVLSPPVLFAAERANPDLLIFIFVIGMAHLPLRQGAAVYGLAFFGGLIKYYPFVLLALVLRESPRRLMLVTAIAVVGLGLFVAIYATGIREGVPHIAGGNPFGDLFGLKNFTIGVFMILYFHGVGLAAAYRVAAVATVCLFVAAVIFTAECWQYHNLPAALRGLRERDRVLLVAGALLICGCFLAGQSVGYRAIFLLLILPELFALRRQGAAPSWLIGAVLLLLWSMGLRCWAHVIMTGQLPSPSFASATVAPVDVGFWALREMLWWVAVAFLLTNLLAFALGSPVLAAAGRKQFRLA